MDLDGNVESIKITESNDAYLESPKDAINRHIGSIKGDLFIEKDELGSIKVEKAAAAAKTGGVPYELNVSIKIGTDTSAPNKIVGDGGTVDNWLAEVFTHVQNHYYHATLGHRINFDVGG